MSSIAMAQAVSAQMNGSATPSLEEEEELYTQLLQIRDAVIAGTHPHFKLPPAAIAQLKASIAAENASAAAAAAAVPASSGAVNGAVNNGAAFQSNASTYQTQRQSAVIGLPGLQNTNAAPVCHAQPPALKPASSGGLDPIFLEKSDSLVRAEGQLKRQRIERELQSQLDQRRHPRDKDPGAEGPSPIDVQAILNAGISRTGHVSGLSLAKAASLASSFDENDYYSSQVESDWSSPASVSRAPDRAAGPLTANLGSAAFSAAPSSSLAKPVAVGKASVRDSYAQSSLHAQIVDDDDDEYNPEDMDDEYTPPDATAFDDLYDDNYEPQQSIPAEDDNDDYEPGEITQESNVPTPPYQQHQPAEPSPRVPVYSNHLTHIAAPQPNRVSPLAVAKGPNIELELVNGRPEVVHKERQNQPAAQSRASTASPSANGVAGGNKKHRKKKRKRESEPTSRGKRKQRVAAAHSPASPAYAEPRIKDEPVSPPPFANVPETQSFDRRTTQYRPAEIDLVSPHQVQPSQYAEPQRSGLRYEYAQPSSPAIPRLASPASYRPAQRDTQDLRRVASMHYAQRPVSPAQHSYTPAPARTASMTYGDPRLAAPPAAAADQQKPRYEEHAALETVRYVRADRSRSPPRMQEYRDAYARASSPMIMPPPTAAPPRKIVVDQYGNRYYAADPVTASVGPTPVRASVAPVDKASAEHVYDRAPSRIATAYGQAPPEAARYEPVDSRMGPPAARREQPLYVDANGYPIHDYNARPIEQVRYAPEPTSPVYQQAPRYEPMAPPPAPPHREQTSPVYVPTRSYSVRPEEPAGLSTAYVRQASVAPMQYIRQDPVAAPPRAMSIMPGYEQPSTQGRAYSHAPAPQQVRYVDQYGREVYPEVRPVPAGGEYRYQ